MQVEESQNITERLSTVHRDSRALELVRSSLRRPQVSLAAVSRAWLDLPLNKSTEGRK